MSLALVNRLDLPSPHRLCLHARRRFARCLMWTMENRPQYERKGLRYPSDLTDAEWECVKASIPPAKRGGRRRTVDVRGVLDAVLYVLSTGCQSRALPR